MFGGCGGEIVLCLINKIILAAKQKMMTVDHDKGWRVEYRE
jgi:hypothetical protein